MIWRTGIIFAFIVAMGVLAYQIGARLSDEAIMTIVGLLCGILASIPVSIGLLVALTRERAAYSTKEYVDIEPDPEPSSYTIYRPPAPPQPQLPPHPTQTQALRPQLLQPPQIIVVAPSQTVPQNYLPYQNYTPPQLNAPAAPMHERTFKIVGEQDGD